jgi:hypothetical protein
LDKLYKNLTHRYYHQRSHGDASTFWSGCGAVLKSAFQGVGGFDVVTYTRPSIEDIDLGYRLRDAGGRILLLPELLGKHLKVWSVGNVIHTDIFLRAIPWARLMISREGITDDLNVSKAERGRAVLAGLLVLSLLSLAVLPQLWPLCIVMVAVVVAANWEFFWFMRDAGTIGLALKGLAFHQIYYLYSSAAFAYCWVETILFKKRR